MIRKAHTPQHPGTLIQLGRRIRLAADGLWAWQDEILRVPTGSAGTVVPWKAIYRDKQNHDLTLNCGFAIVFDDIKHPEFNGFPMCRHDINWDVLPDNMEAI